MGQRPTHHLDTAFELRLDDGVGLKCAEILYVPGGRGTRHDEQSRIEALGALDPQSNRLPLGHGHHEHASLGDPGRAQDVLTRDVTPHDRDALLEGACQRLVVELDHYVWHRCAL